MEIDGSAGKAAAEPTPWGCPIPAFRSLDYDRMLRQNLPRAPCYKLDPITVLTASNKIAAASKEVVATDIPPSDRDRRMNLALKAKGCGYGAAADQSELPDLGSYNVQTVEIRLTLRGH